MTLAFARAVGAALSGLFAVVLRLRAPRPIHAHGRLLEGEIRWLPGAAASGVTWVDEAPEHPQPVTARLSRSIGFPLVLPDIIGLALRVDAGGRPADIEFATTGIGVPSRFLLVPHRRPGAGTFGVLLPYRSPRGPVLLAARGVPARRLPAGGDERDAALATEPWVLRLYWGTPWGKWHPFAEMSLRPAARTDDTALRFDAVRHPIPGATAYRWTAALRQPSYRRAQRAGDDAAVASRFDDREPEPEVVEQTEQRIESARVAVHRE